LARSADCSADDACLSGYARDGPRAHARINARTVEPLALSPDEAAAALGVFRDYLDEHVSHELRWVRRGRRKFVAVKELERWLDEAAERVIA
jgi:hypothetical protein